MATFRSLLRDRYYPDLPPAAALLDGRRYRGCCWPSDGALFEYDAWSGQLVNLTQFGFDLHVDGDRVVTSDGRYVIGRVADLVVADD